MNSMDWRHDLVQRMMGLLSEWDNHSKAENAKLLKKNQELENSMTILRNYNLYVGSCVASDEVPMDFGEWVSVRLGVGESE